MSVVPSEPVESRTSGNSLVVDWPAAVELLGLEPRGAGSACPVCRTGELAILQEPGGPGRTDSLWWAVCGCGLSDDIFGIAARVWKSNRRQAIRTMTAAGYRFPESAVREYLVKTAGCRRLLREISKKFGTPESPAMTIPAEDLRKLAGRFAISGKAGALAAVLKRRTAATVFSIFDLPGRPSGLLVLPEKAESGKAIVLRLPNLPENDVGFLGWEDRMPQERGVVLQDQQDFRQIAAAARNLIHRPAVLGWSAEFTGPSAWTSLRAWCAAATICGSPTAAMLSGAAISDSAMVRMRTSLPGWVEKAAGPVGVLFEELRISSKSWQTFATRWLKSRRETRAEALRELADRGLSVDRLRSAADVPLIRELDSCRTAEPKTGKCARLDEARNVVQVGSELYVRGRNGVEHKISTVTVRLHRVVRLTASRTTWLDGVLECGGKKIPFFEPEEIVGPKWIRGMAMDAGAGIPVIGAKWAGKLVEISERLHNPALVRIRDDVGWDPDARELVLPGYSIVMGGKVRDNMLPEFHDLPFTGGVGVSKPVPLELATVRDMFNSRFGSPASVMICGVAGALLAPAVGRKAHPLWLYGEAAVATARALAGPLGCPVLDASTSHERRRLAGFRESAWPSILICRDRTALASSEVRDWLLPGLPNRFAVVDRETALSAAVSGHANVYECRNTDVLKSMNRLVELVRMTFPAFLLEWCRRYGRPSRATVANRRCVGLIQEHGLELFGMVNDALRGPDARLIDGRVRKSIVSPEALWPVRSSGHCQEAAEAVMRLLVDWVSRGEIRLVATGFDELTGQKRLATYDLDRDVLELPVRLLDAMLADIPTPTQALDVRHALEAAGMTKPGSSEVIGIPYGVWRKRALARKKVEPEQPETADTRDDRTLVRQNAVD